MCDNYLVYRLLAQSARSQTHPFGVHAIRCKRTEVGEFSQTVVQLCCPCHCSSMVHGNKAFFDIAERLRKHHAMKKRTGEVDWILFRMKQYPPSVFRTARSFLLHNGPAKRIRQNSRLPPMHRITTVSSVGCTAPSQKGNASAKEGLLVARGSFNACKITASILVTREPVQSGLKIIRLPALKKT